MNLKLILILTLAAALILTNLFQCNQSKQDRTTIDFLNSQIKAMDSAIQVREDRIDSLLSLPAIIKHKYHVKKDSIHHLSADSIDSILRTVTRN